MVASALLAVVFGASLGNLIRGVALENEGLRGMALFTNFLIGREPGILDWYTVLVGIFTLVALAVHGALYLAWRTTGPVRERSVAFALEAWKAALVLWVAATAATAWVRPDLFSSLFARPWALLFVALAIAGAWGAFRFPRLGRDLEAFLSSSAFLLGMLAATLAGQYPFWLRSTLDPAHSLTALNSASDHYGLRVALTWWPVGIALVAVYFTFLFRWMAGKVDVESEPSYGSAIAGGVDSPAQRT
jgi:cytochrome d ubiquinol oxidase subunit II